MTLLPLILWGITGTIAYVPLEKGNYFPGLVLQDLVNRMRKESEMSYIDLGDNGMPLGSRSLEEEQFYPLDYELGDALHPSIRDQEYLQHSSLWGSQYVSGGAGEGKQRLKPQGTFPNKQEVKSDNSLPAYCNPPNPCPVGYQGVEGCLEEFENTASFSRRYQALQNCMCDTEHMFDCPSHSNPFIDDGEMEHYNDLNIHRFVQRDMRQNENPFLSGDKLPVAAKKGKMAF